MNMKSNVLSKKGLALIELYKQMAETGYSRTDGSVVSNAFSDFELRPFRKEIREVFNHFGIQSVLDYGSGGSNWDLEGFDTEGSSAKDYFNLAQVFKYEPARGLDQRQKVDCTICFDVLEHIYIQDVLNVIRDLFSNSTQLVIVNVACYPAAATLPNGENAHITVRDAHWWKAMFDMVSLEFPETHVWLLCSKSYQAAGSFNIWRAKDWQDSPNFVTE